MNYPMIILAAAKVAKVSGALLLAICTHESGLNNVFVPHDGGSPSIGICQIKQATAEMVGLNYTQTDLMDPTKNARAAARYLKFQQERYDGDLVKMVASYNAGKYNESKKAIGCPKNLKYVKSVQSKLNNDLQHTLACGDEIKKEVKICIWYGRFSEPQCFFPKNKGELIEKTSQ